MEDTVIFLNVDLECLLILVNILDLLTTNCLKVIIYPIGKIEDILKFFKNNYSRQKVFRILLITKKVQSEVKKSDHLFAYLLKTQLSELHFDRLIESDFLQLGVLFFRYIVIKNQLSIDMNTLIEKDIHKSLKVTNNRQYTS